MHRPALLSLLLLAGCAAEPAHEAGRLTLLAPVTVPAASATARLQYGQVVPASAIRDYDPYCLLELDTVGDGPQTVAADTFTIMRIGRLIDTFAASEARLVPVFLNNESRPTLIYYKTRFALNSQRQPQVRMLTCLSNQNMPGVYPFMRHLTLEEMRRAVGPDFRLDIN